MDSNVLIICKVCNEILKQPIRLPCDNYICKAHENELIQTECILCYQKHSVPENGWKIDQIMQNMVNHIKTTQSNICKDPNYKELSELVRIYENELESYKVKVENPTHMIEEYYSELVNKIDLRSEILKSQIDETSKRFKEKINKEKELCKAHLSQRNKSNEVNIIEEKEKLKRCNMDLRSSNLTAFGERLSEMKTSMEKLRECEKQLKEGIFYKKIKFLEGKENFEEVQLGKIEIEQKTEILNRNGDSSTWELKRTLTGHGDTVYSLAVFQNGDLASGSGYMPFLLPNIPPAVQKNLTIKIWDSSTGSLKQT